MKYVVRIGLLPGIFILLLHISCSKESAGGASSGAGGSLAKFAVVGDYLYILSDSKTLAVYDIVDPRQPKEKKKMTIGNNLETIFPYKNKLYIGSSNGMYIVSVEKPSSPVVLGSVSHLPTCDPVVSNDSVSYVTLRSGNRCGNVNNVLNVYNTKTVTNPVLIEVVQMLSPWGLGLNGKALYVCDGANGLVIYDLSNPWIPARKQTFTDNEYYDVIPYNNTLIAWVGTGVVFFDMTDPLNPVKQGELKD